MLKSKEKHPDTEAGKPRKAVIRKIATMDKRREQFPFWSSVTKAGKPIKVVIRKIATPGQGKCSFQMG